MQKEDRMDSFVLAETFKYLYLLFSEVILFTIYMTLASHLYEKNVFNALYTFLIPCLLE